MGNKKILSTTAALIAIRNFFGDAAKTESDPYLKQAAKAIASKIEPLESRPEVVDDGLEFENDLGSSSANDIFKEAIMSLKNDRKIEMPESEYPLQKLINDTLKVDSSGTSYWAEASGYSSGACAYDKIGNRHIGDIATDAISLATIRTESNSLRTLAGRILKNFVDSDTRLYEVFLRLRKSYLAVTNDPRFAEEAFTPYLPFAKRFDPYRADGNEFVDFRDFPIKINRSSIREYLL